MMLIRSCRFSSANCTLPLWRRPAAPPGAPPLLHLDTLFICPPSDLCPSSGEAGLYFRRHPNSCAGRAQTLPPAYYRLTARPSFACKARTNFCTFCFSWPVLELFRTTNEGSESPNRGPLGALEFVHSFRALPESSI